MTWKAENIYPPDHGPPVIARPDILVAGGGAAGVAAAATAAEQGRSVLIVERYGLMVGAPENSMVIDQDGYVGIGTMLPAKELHLASSGDTSFRMDANTDFWELRATGSTTFNGYFAVRDANLNTSPLLIENGAPTQALRIDENGDIDLGTSAPEGKLHTKGDGVQLAYFESGDGGPVQVRFRTDSENRRFLAVNNANEVKSQLIFLDDRINFTGETDSGANLWLSVGPDGIVSQGPDCDTPCDAVFDPEIFEVPDIKERAAQMWANRHLPAVGPTSPDQPFNLTQKAGGMLHELEIAHIYIEKLHDELEAQKTVIAAQSDRFRAMEARLEALEGD